MKLYAVYNVLFYVYRDSIVYKENAVSMKKGEYMSLGPYKKVSDGVLIAWSSYLSNMEKLKAPETVPRLFFSVQNFVSLKIPYLN